MATLSLPTARLETAGFVGRNPAGPPDASRSAGVPRSNASSEATSVAFSRHRDSLCLRCKAAVSSHIPKRSVSIGSEMLLADPRRDASVNSQLFGLQVPSKNRLGRNRKWSSVTLNAMEAMETTSFFDNDDVGLRDELSNTKGANFSSLSLGRIYPPKNRADDSSLSNPLLRLNRMGCGWLAVVLEWEGVIVEDDVQIERKAWLALAEEEGRPHPMAFILKRAEGMKKEHAIAEVLCWSRDYKNMKRLANRHEEIYQEMQGGYYRLRPGAKEFIETMCQQNIPIAIASTKPRKSLERAIEAVGLEGVFGVVIASEDVYRGKPDPEMFEYAAQKLEVIPERCIVIGNSNISVEAAHDALMKCVAVAGKHPSYELSAAELVVRRLDELSVVDLKNLVAVESPEFLPPAPIPELELEPETVENTKPVTTMNWF